MATGEHDGGPSSAGADLGRRLESVGQRLGAREAAHRKALEEARARAEKLRSIVIDGVGRFHAAAAAVGAAHLEIEVGEIRLDDKHVRAVEFDVGRGRYRAIVTVKSRGEVTLVGPFRAGKTEGPCRSFPFEAERELQDALGGFLEEFLEAAATP